MGITLRQETYNRFLRAAEFVESFRRGPSFLRGGYPNNVSPLTQNVLVTSTTAVDGRYPGKWLIRHEVDNQWLTQEADIWIRERNNAALTTKRYLGWRTGDAPDGKPCFLVDATAPLGCDIQPVGCESDCGESLLAAREDHVHEYAYNDATPAPTNCDADPGESCYPAREDHVHDLTFGTDVQDVGTANSPGDDCLPARVDHVHAFTWPECVGITLHETDVLCEGYSLNVYTRAVSINIVEGCLTASAGSWVFSHAAGCCDCCELYWCVDCACVQACEEPVGATGGPFTTLAECQAACYEPWWCVDGACVQACEPPVGYTSGPHASESECIGSGCVETTDDPCCGCEASPATWILTVAGITNNGCANCTNYNGTFSLPYVTACLWQHDGAITQCPTGEEDAAAYQLLCVPGDGVWRVIPFGGDFDGAPRWEKSIASWNCLGTNVLTLATSESTACSTWPATVTVVPG